MNYRGEKRGLRDRFVSLKNYEYYYFFAGGFVLLFAFVLLLVLFFPAEMVLLTPPANAVNVSGCVDLNVDNRYYVLNNSLIVRGDANQRDCLVISGDNITLDGLYNELFFNGSSPGFAGVLVTGNNAVVKDLNVSLFHQGVKILDSIGGRVENVNLFNNTNYGIYLSNANSTTIDSNRVELSIYGIFSSLGRNNIIRNNLLIGGTAASPNSPGIYGISFVNSSNNFADSNEILFHEKAVFVTGNSGGNVINLTRIYLPVQNGYFFPDNSGSNYIFGGFVDGSSRSAILVRSGGNLAFENVSVIRTYGSYYDFEFGSVSSNEAHFKDMKIGRYNFGNSGGIVSFEKTGSGRIRFLQNINGSGANFSDDVKIGNNFAEVKSENNRGLNKSAEIRLDGSSGLNNSIILRNGQQCSSIICSNLTFSGTSAVFNVSYWTNYSIGQGNQSSSSFSIAINEPDEGDVYRNNSFPVTFEVVLNSDGRVNYTLNRGATNTTMNSTDNRTFTKLINSLGNGNYVFTAYAQFFANNTLLQRSVNFSVNLSQQNPPTNASSGSNTNTNTNNSVNNTINQNQGTTANNTNVNLNTTSGGTSGAKKDKVELKDIAFWLVVSVIVILILILGIVIFRKIKDRKVKDANNLNMRRGYNFNVPRASYNLR